MLHKNISSLVIAANTVLMVASAPAMAQDAGARLPAVVSAPVSADGAGCELHLFPTRNYVVYVEGWGSVLAAGVPGLGVLGAAAAGGLGGAIDGASSANQVKSLDELMALYLPPDEQVTQLKRANLLSVLKLPADTAIIVESPPASAKEAKADPAVKEKLKAISKEEKAGKRLTASTTKCYAEFHVNMVFYQKAIMYGTRLFTGFTLRNFSGQTEKPLTYTGMVQNRAAEFPARTPEKVAEAKAALLDAFAADLPKWANEKMQPRT